MAARRPLGPCPLCNTDTPYPVWPDFDGPATGDDDLHGALTELSAALTACASPLTSSIAQLTPADISKVLTATPMAQRPMVLRPLNLMIRPRNIGQQLCRDVLKLLSQADEHAARHAASALADPITLDIGRNAHAAEFADRGIPGIPVDPAERWSPALARLAVWANGVASVTDARVWLWAAEQPWFRPDSVTDEQVAAIVAAAMNVLAASPDYRYLGPELASSLTTTPPAPADADTPTNDGDPEAEAPSGSVEPDATHQENRPMTALAADTTSNDVAGGAATPTAEQLRQAGEALRHALQDAIPAAQRILDDVTADRPPAEGDLAALTDARTSFDEAVTALNAAGSSAELDTGAAVQSAVAELLEAADDAPVRTRLAQLRSLAAPDSNAPLAAALAAAQERAGELDALTSWTGHQRAAAVALTAVLELADPTTPPEQLMALQQQLVQAHQDLALLAVSASQLIRQAEPADIPVSAAADEPTAAREDPQATDESEPVPADEAEHQPAPAAPEATYTEASSEASGTETPTAPERENQVGAPTADPAPEQDAVSVPAASTEEAAPSVAAPMSQSVAVSDEVAAHAHLVDGLATLIGSSRFGMAAEIERVAGSPAGQQSALRIAALSDVVRSETGAVNAALRSELTDLDTAAVMEDSPSAVLAVASVLRAALVTGEPTAGARLTEMTARVEPNLAAVAEQVGRRALQGVLIDAPPLTVLADVTEVERALSAAGAAAGAMLRPRTLRFKRATDIAKTWMAADGLLGRPLTIAATDDRAAVNEVAIAIRQLGDPTYVAKEIDTLDRKYKGMSGKPIEGAGRQDLVNLAAEAVQTLAGWTEAVLSLKRASSSQQWSAGEVADMRSEVLGRRTSVLDALAAQAERPDPLLAAASRAAAASLSLTFAVLDGTAALPQGEPMPALALTAELLKVPGAAVDTALGRVTVPESTTVAELLAAAGRSWADAVDSQVAAENFAAADFLLTAAGAGLLPAPAGASVSAEAATMVAAAHTAVQGELQTIHEQLTTELRRARSNNEVSEEQAGELTGLLGDADPRATRNLAAVRARLEQIAQRLPEYRAESARRLSERLAALPGVDAEAVARVTKLIGTGDLSTAEELIYFLEIGERVPRVAERHDLQQFFPAVSDALAYGLTGDLIETVRGRRHVPGCAVLDYSGLSGDLAALAATALDGWRQLAVAPAESRRRLSERELLLPALRLAGIEGARIRQLDGLPRGGDRRFIDIDGVTTSGMALVPAFGSKLGGRLRVLLAWGQPPAQLLLSHADQDNSGDSLLIAYFGTMSAATRRELAEAAVANSRTAPVVVLDDAALAYLAAHGNRQIDATMSVLLPFSNVNPYVSKKRGLVAEEMFYGRDAERKNVLDPDGTQLLYGGRGLGKSALLRSAGAKFESQGDPGERISLYLDTVGIGAGSAIDAEAIWDALLQPLTARGVLSAPPRRGGARKNAHEQVRTGVLAWLNEDPRRRMLILLDETDRFFESDAPGFIQTNRLKDLGLSTDGRIKVVFAGLHSVQRYAKSARNGPFSHLAQRPTVIGPLRPQFATNLLTRPLQALGYRFADDDLVNRVLGYCSYQPFLLQMFGWRLVATMHDRRRAEGVVGGEPPYVITRADVAAVESNVDLKADISTAFHDTLHLDPRYNVIANVLAHHAHESGLDARLSDVALRDECLAWWPDGFTKLDIEGFRAYLQEMVGLGVLAPNNDARGWHLRSPNVLQMIGSKDDVITQLVGAATLSVPDEFLALETRAELPEGRRSPLTAGQIDDVLGNHANQVRVVLGSEATGIGDVARAVRQAADVGNRFTVPHISSRRQFEEELVAGRPGDRRVVLDDLVALAPKDEACTEALNAALQLRPQQPGVTRSAVLIAGPQQMNLWWAVLGEQGNASAVGTVTLRRYNRQTLRVWALSTEKFSAQDRQERLLEVTGGWPMLVERAAELVAGGQDEGQALTTVADELASPAGAAAFVDAVGLTADEELVRAFNAMLSLVDSTGVALTDLVAAASMAVDDPDTAVACLQALGVFDVDADGVHRLEPLLVQAWPHRA